MKVAVIGASGQLGHDVASAFANHGDDVIPVSHSDVELSDFDSVSNYVTGLNPDFIVNTAAMHHVENCERDPQKAFAVNGLGAKNLALAARDTGTTLLHVSTDYVFDGAKRSPYEETDVPRPLNVYGNTKLSGEYFVSSIAPKHFVLRTSAIYGTNPCRAKGGLNFVELMLKLAKEREELRVVDHEVVSPTSTVEIARQIVILSRSDKYGLYHGTSEGSCSWHAFAREIFSLTNTRVNLQIAKPGEFPAKVNRPEYSVLENRMLKNHGLNAFQPWRESLIEYLSSRNSH